MPGRRPRSGTSTSAPSGIGRAVAPRRQTPSHVAELVAVHWSAQEGRGPAGDGPAEAVDAAILAEHDDGHAGQDGKRAQAELSRRALVQWAVIVEDEDGR